MKDTDNQSSKCFWCQQKQESVAITGGSWGSFLRFLPIKPSFSASKTAAFWTKKRGMKLFSAFVNSRIREVMPFWHGKSLFLIFYFVKNREDDFPLRYVTLWDKNLLVSGKQIIAINQVEWNLKGRDLSRLSPNRSLESLTDFVRLLSRCADVSSKA